MGGEGKLYTRRGKHSFAAGLIHNGQDIYWQARQKTSELVRPKRTGATDSYEPTRKCCKPGALDPPLQPKRCLQPARKTHPCVH